jgi:hypothetical protein
MSQNFNKGIFRRFPNSNSSRPQSFFDAQPEAASLKRVFNYGDSSFFFRFRMKSGRRLRTDKRGVREPVAKVQ